MKPSLLTSPGLLTTKTRSIVFIGALMAQAVLCFASPPLPLTLVRDIPLPGGVSRFDYQSLDPRSGRLFIAHLGASQLVVFDIEAQRVVANIDHIDRVHGVLAVPSLKRVYASATGTDEIVMIDEETLQPVARMPGGKYPDGLSYSPEYQKLFVSDEWGHTLTTISTDHGQNLGALDLGGEIGNNQYDPVTRHVFANVQTLGQLVEVDAKANNIVRRHHLSGCDSNHGLLIAPENRLAFIACEGNAKLLVFDMRSMSVIHEDSVGQTPDVLAFDSILGRLYVASESGVVSVFRITSTGMVKDGEGWVAAGAHSILVDPGTHLVYLPLENVNGQPVLRIMKPSWTTHESP